MNKEYKEENERDVSPEDMNYSEIVEPYQKAFGGPPWYEVSTCIDEELPQRCPSGLSSTAIGEICTRCGLAPRKPAYEAKELTMRFEELATTRSTSWYTEKVGENIAMAAVAWKTNSQIVTKEKYADVPLIGDWLQEVLGDIQTSFIWLDEVFADKSVRQNSNLSNFGAMCRGFSIKLDSNVIAFRTINEAMVRAAKRDFGNQAAVFRSESKEVSTTERRIPDRRDFVIITITGDEQ